MSRNPVPILKKTTTHSKSGINCKLCEKVKIFDNVKTWICPTDIANNLRNEMQNLVNNFCNSSGGGINTGPLPPVPNGVLVEIVSPADLCASTKDPKYGGCGGNCGQSFSEGTVGGPPYNITSYGLGKCKPFYDYFIGPHFRQLYKKTICKSSKKLGIGKSVKANLKYQVDYGVTITCNGKTQNFTLSTNFNKNLDTYYENTLEVTKIERRVQENHCCRGTIYLPGGRCW